MKLPGAPLLAALGLASSSVLFAADPAKVDYTERNTSYAPGASVTPTRRTPEVNDSLQNRRLAPNLVEKSVATPGERSAVIDMTETNAKKTITPSANRPEATGRKVSAFDHRESRYQPDAAHEAPKLVTRYQSALNSARTLNEAHASAGDPAATARVNRFVFRRNTPTPLGTPSAVPATGGAGALLP